MAIYTSIQFRLNELVRQGSVSQAYAELEMWARENPGPETEVRVRLIRAGMLRTQFGPSPAIEELFREALKLARRLRPGLRALALTTLMNHAAEVGNQRLLQASHRAWSYLFKRHPDDPEVRELYPYICASLGYAAVGRGLSRAAAIWFERAAANPNALQDRAFAGWCLALSAHEFIKLGRFSTAAERLERARQFMPNNLHSSAIIPCVQAELALAEGQLDQAVALVSAMPSINIVQTVRVLAACVTTRLYGTLGRNQERRRWAEYAREQLEPHAPVWLRHEVGMLQAH